jgi:hypothetical protein
MGSIVQAQKGELGKQKREKEKKRKHYRFLLKDRLENSILEN